MVINNPNHSTCIDPVRPIHTNHRVLRWRSVRVTAMCANGGNTGAAGLPCGMLMTTVAAARVIASPTAAAGCAVDVGVAEPVAEDFQVDACVEREGGIGVANVVEPDPRDAGSVGKPVEHPGDGLWVRCPAVRVAEDAVVFGEERAELGTFGLDDVVPSAFG
jgi:hypothetical protein